MNHSNLPTSLPPVIQTAQQQFAELRHERSVPILETSNSKVFAQRAWFAAPIAATLVLALTLALPDRPGEPVQSFGDRPQPDPYSALHRGADELSRWGQGFGSAVARQPTPNAESSGRVTGLRVPPRPRSSVGFAPVGDDVS